MVVAADRSLGDIPQPPTRYDPFHTADLPIPSVSSTQRETAARTHLMFSASGQFGLAWSLQPGKHSTPPQRTERGIPPGVQCF